jgi:hypothetical protein
LASADNKIQTVIREMKHSDPSTKSGHKEKKQGHNEVESIIGNNKRQVRKCFLYVICERCLADLEMPRQHLLLLIKTNYEKAAYHVIHSSIHSNSLCPGILEGGSKPFEIVVYYHSPGPG